MLKDERIKTKEAIEANRMEMSGLTRWGNTGAKEVIALANTFCDKLVENVDSLSDEKKVHFMVYFSNLALITVATTRDFEALSEYEIKAYEKLFDIFGQLCEESIELGVSDCLFSKIYYVRDIILENAVGREDFDCKYREGMIFPDHVDMYRIVKAIVTYWKVLYLDSDFSLVFSQFKRDWHEHEMKFDNDSTRPNGRERAAKFMAIIKDYATLNE